MSIKPLPTTDLKAATPMTIDPDEYRLYKPQLARRFACTPRTIYNWWVAGILPAPRRDEFDRPFNYASEIAEHEANLERSRLIAANVLQQ